MHNYSGPSRRGRRGNELITIYNCFDYIYNYGGPSRRGRRDNELITIYNCFDYIYNYSGPSRRGRRGRRAPAAAGPAPRRAPAGNRIIFVTLNVTCISALAASSARFR